MFGVLGMSYSPSKDSIFSILSKLCSVVGPSGYEDDVRGIVVDELKPYADSLWIDSLGNVIALKKGRGEGKLMLAGHMDEIGLMISYIDDKGFLRFNPIGGWSERILPGQRVLIKTSTGKLIRGVIGSKPPHIMKPEEAQKVIPMKELFIDIGATSRDEARKLGVEVGDVAVIDRDVARIGNGDIVTGRAFDDRIGVAVMIEAFKALENTNVDIYAVATVQEEVGLKGARVAAYSIEPHVALALDVTIANDIPGVPENEWVTRIGKGPAIKIMDGRSGSGLIAHPAVRKLLIEVAKEENIPYQLEVLPGGTTDASIIQLNKEGVPAGTVSIPTRYVHSPIELLSLEDALNATKLVIGFAKRITRTWIEANLRRTIK